MSTLQNYNRHVKYVNKDFAQMRQALINYAKTYFPNTVGDFNETSPVTMFIEMAAYVGDVNGFYSDVQLQESMLYTVDERINLYNLAQSHGYKPKTVVPASVDLDLYQLVPSIGEGNETRPDFRYALVVESNMQVSADNGTQFRTLDAVDFRFSSSFDPTEISAYNVTDDGAIEYYLLKKKVKGSSGKLNTATYTFTEPKKYDKIVLPEDNVVEIVDMVDSDFNKWYEVPYMAQDTVPISVKNSPYNNPEYARYRSSVPYILCYKQTEHRFVTRIRKDDKTEIQFGAGLSSEADEEIVPNPYNVAIGLDYFQRVTDVSIDPMNFLYTKTYGSAPYNTTLTIRYVTGGGIADNVAARTITQIDSATIIDPIDVVDQSVLTTIRNSLTVNNPRAAFGGMTKKPMDVIREEAIANFAAQNRAVTKEDYILRCYTMPAKYGAIVTAYIDNDTQLTQWNEDNRVPNPYTMNLYALGYDYNRNFVPINEVLKQNLRNYMSMYRLMTDALNIKDPYIINIGVEVEIITRPSENSNEVILRVLDKVIKMLDNDNMGINQPIMINKIRTEVDKLDGVQTVQSIKFKNLFDTNLGYSGNVYPIEAATRNGILYPSVTPSIFEVKYPRRDISVRVTDI